jgi:hypothetical protein
MEELKELQKKYNALEKKLTEAEQIIKDPSKRGYYALCKIVYQQIEYLEGFNLQKEIGENPKEDKVYDRVKAIWEGLKNMIMDCRSLKQELKITPEDDEKESKKISRTTPESIADVLNNTAGKVN